MRIYLASQPHDLRYLIKNNTPYVLISYYYFKSKRTQEEWAPYFSRFKDVIIDSGAFSMMRDKKKAFDLDKYVQDYIKFIKKYQFEHYIELDIDSVVGYERVKQYREKLESGIGWKSIPVWHINRGKEGWLELLKDYNYIAMGGFLTDGVKTKDYGLLDWFLHTAKKNGVKVHGLAYTNTKTLKRVPFYSVDSTTWRLGGAWKYICKFEKNRIQIYRFEMRKPKLSNAQLVDFNCQEWTKFANWAEAHL